MSYNNYLPNFTALHNFFEEVGTNIFNKYNSYVEFKVLDDDEAEHFFKNLLPKIISLALRLPEVIPGSLPLLKRDHNRSLSLSQLQIASLLANAFLCTFPWRNDEAVCPGVNFSRLFTSHMRENRRDSVAEKLKCLFHYFKRVTTTSKYYRKYFIILQNLCRRFFQSIFPFFYKHFYYDFQLLLQFLFYVLDQLKRVSWGAFR